MNRVSGTNFKKTKLIHDGVDIQVYEGLHAKFGRKVLIKELRGEANEITRKDFFQEANQWAQIEHSRLSRIEEINEDRGWVVSEFLPEALNARICDGVELSELKQATMQILDALAHVHSKGMLHCNLSAENIRLSGEGLKITDGRGVSLRKISPLPRPRGSNRFRAPEMLDNQFGPIGMATDLYLAGSVILEALVGDRFDSLFQGYVEGTPDPETGWLRWHNSDDPLEPIKTLVPSVPNDFAKLLDDMLSKNVRSRIGTAKDAMNELRSIEMVGRLRDEEAKSAPAPNAADPRVSAPAAPTGPSQNAVGAAAQLISRPNAPAYIRIASGAMAGTIYPVPLKNILIGEKDSCDVKLSATDYEKIRGREVEIILGTGGWKICETKRPEDCSETIFIGHEACKTTLPVKSGDIIRLSDTGPDIQFVIQGEAKWAWQDVADELGMVSEQVRALPTGNVRSAAAPSPAAGSPSHPSPPPRPARPPRRAPSVQPRAPSPPENVDHFAAPPAPPSPKRDKGWSNSKKPRQGQNSDDDAGISDWFTDKDKRNWLVLIGGLIAVGIIIPLALGGGAPEENEETESSQTEVVQPVEIQEPSLALDGADIDLANESVPAQTQPSVEDITPANGEPIEFKDSKDENQP